MGVGVGVGVRRAGGWVRVWVKSGQDVQEGDLLIKLNDASDVAQLHSLKAYRSIYEKEISCSSDDGVDGSPLPIFSSCAD